MLELELATMYQPQNFYCYALDANMNPYKVKYMNQLASCFPNVHTIDARYAMYMTDESTRLEIADRAARLNATRAQLDCMKWLTEGTEKRWKYVILLQVCMFMEFYKKMLQEP